MELFSKDGKNRKNQKQAKAQPARETARGKSKPDGASGARSRKNGKGRVVAAVVAIVAAVVVLGCAVGVIAVNKIDTVFPNVSLDGIDIGGMSDIQLSQLLLENGYESAGDVSVKVELPLDFVLEVESEDVCTNSDVTGIVDNIMNACHNGSSVTVAARYVKCLLGGGMELESGAGLSVDRDAVRAIVENMVKQVNLSLMSSELTIGEDSIKVVKGAASITLDVDEISELVINAFLEQNYETIVYDAEISGDSELDLNSLYETVHCEPEDARYDPETDSIVPEVCGLSFDMLSARQLWKDAEYGDEVVIPLIVTPPEIDAEYLESVLFRDCFCSKATSLIGSSSNRINNVTLAAAAINGVVLMPGDEFSYNDVVGERTAERGYLPAGAYSGGQTVMEYGGGICQVSSTLYYCALYANLKITARTCHMFPVGYLPAGLDATVSWGGPEFKFVNDREYPVKIAAFVEGNSVTVEIWGTNVDGSYVEMNYGTSYMYDKEYTDVVIGYKAVTYRSVFDKDGNLISKNLEANSTYNYHEEDIKWPEPSESPEPTEELPEETPVETEPPTETEEPIETDVPVWTELPEETGEPEVPPEEELPEPTEPVGGFLT